MTNINIKWLWGVLTSRPPPHESGALPLSYRAINIIINFNLKDLLYAFLL